MKDTAINQAYELAKERYASIGIDTEKVLSQLQDFHLSMHCWQADDVKGFEVQAGALSGGIQSTGNYPGAARNIDELRADILKAKSLIPGSHRLNLHEIYGDFQGKVVDRDEVTVEHFQSWIDWAKDNNTLLDFNSSSFSHPKSGNLSLSNPDKGIRDFWIEHTKRCRDIADAMGKAQGDPCIMNLWVHDGCKDVSVNHYLYRSLLKDSLDQILSIPYDKSKVYVCLESKVFGIGLESYTVGSSEFTVNYAAKNGIISLMDNGHYHPTEVVSDKISSMLLFNDKIALHVTRPVRWDSDHVVLFDDETREIAKEIVINDAIDRVLLALDFFDAIINRISAWVNGMRNLQKALLYALLTPNARLKELQNESNFSELMTMQEELKIYPFGDVWNYFCEVNGVPERENWFQEVKRYEEDVLSKRN